MKRTALSFLAALLVVGTASTAHAGSVVSGFNTTQLARGDDFFVGPVTLGFDANFFGTTYASTYVSNNGYLTFGAGRSDYTPTGLGEAYAGVPIIAGFFADVDTAGAASGVPAYGTGSFGGRNAFGVTYDRVGYYNDSTDKLNTFQILLVDRGDTGVGNFDIVLNYDQIQWESGNVESPDNNGLGGNSAAVGYNAGQGGAVGTYFQFAGSQVAGSLIDGGSNALVANSNIGVAGRYLFTVRGGSVLPGAVPEPATWAMMIVGFGLVGGAARYRRRRTVMTCA